MRSGNLHAEFRRCVVEPVDTLDFPQPGSKLALGNRQQQKVGHDRSCNFVQGPVTWLAFAIAAGLAGVNPVVARPLDEVRMAGTLRVAVYRDNPPFSARRMAR